MKYRQYLVFQYIHIKEQDDIIGVDDFKTLN